MSLFAQLTAFDPNFIDLTVPQAMVLGLLVYLVCLPLRFRRLGWRRNVWVALLFVYAGAVVSLTLLPIPLRGFSISWENTNWQLSSINWLPLQSIRQMWENSGIAGSYKEFTRIVGGNFVMLLPLGILAPLVCQKLRWPHMLALAAGTPVVIEGLQLVENLLFGSLNVVEIDDFILNSAGCLLGYVLFLLFRAAGATATAGTGKRKRKRKGKRGR